MCFLCERAEAQRLGFIGDGSFVVGLALNTDPVPTQALISNASAQFSQQLVGADGVMDLYLHAPGGAVQVNGGGLGSQTIQSVSISGQDQDYIRSIVNRLDSIIDLDFAFVGDAAQADTAFYYDQDIDVGGSGSGQTLGIAVAGSAGWELFVNYPGVADNWDYRQYVNVHEWGHSLGLEHPFEAGDGDTYNGNSDPWSSAYPEQTVMAYRPPQSGNWPDFFTTSDISALIEIWGAEKQRLGSGNDTKNGADYSDFINGQGGEDTIRALGGNDTVRGGRGADWINGNWGEDTISGDLDDDFLLGGRDRDLVEGGDGNDWVNGNRGSDLVFGGTGDDTVRGGQDDDIIDGGEGNDKYWGDLGADQFRYSGGNDEVMDFDFASGDRIAIKEGLGYSIYSAENNIQIVSSIGAMTLMNASSQGFDLGMAVTTF